MFWKEKINDWENNIYQTYPKNIKKNFFYETYVLDKNMDNKYKEIFIESNELNNVVQDSKPFEKYINESKNKYVTSFNNLSNDTTLIIPILRKNKNFTTIKNFMDNASITQQQKFWKKVATEIKKLLKENEKIYVSTHGKGVNYFHLRLDKYPKYYHTKSLVGKLDSLL
jgi:hypothetical protein